MIRAQEQKLPSGIARWDDQRMIFRCPNGSRLHLLFMAALFGLGFAIALYVTVTRALGNIGLNLIILLFAGSLCALYLGAFLFLSEPGEVDLDWSRQTFRLTYGSVFASRHYCGNLNEFAGVYWSRQSFSDRSTSGLPSHLIRLAWAKPRKGDLLLWSCDHEAMADQVVSDLAKMLNITPGAAALGQFPFRNKRLKRWDEQKLCFYKPTTFRITMGILGKVIAVVSLLVSGALVVTRAGVHFHNGQTTLPVLVLDIIALLCLRAAGPDELEADIVNRSYVCRCGFLGFARTWRGPLTDIVAVKTNKVADQNGTLVRLVWKQFGRGEMTIGEFNTSAEAEAHRRLIGAELGFQYD